jgi:hypothetical protein
MEYAGLHASTDRVVQRGAQWLWLDKAGHVTAGAHINDWDHGIDPIKELIESGAVLEFA